MVCNVCGSKDFSPIFIQGQYAFIRCSHCGLVRLDPLPSQDDLVTHYATRAENGNYELSKANERRATLAAIFQKSRSLVSYNDSSIRLLDLGCYDGAFLDFAVACGWYAEGVELQGEAVRKAREKHGDRVQIGDLETTPPIIRYYFRAWCD
jgi:hypothetical protein